MKLTVSEADQDIDQHCDAGQSLPESTQKENRVILIF